MQNSPIPMLTGIAPSKAQVTASAAAPDLPADEAADAVTFESLLAQQTQAQPAPKADDLALFVGRQNLVKGQSGRDGAEPQQELPAVTSDIAALFATLVQAVVPGRTSEASVSTGVGAAGAAKSDAVIAGVGRNALSNGLPFTGALPNGLPFSGALPNAHPPFAPGESPAVGEGNAPLEIRARPGVEAAEIAGAGKELPFSGAKIEGAGSGFDKLEVAQNTIQMGDGVHAAQTEIFSQVTGVQGSGVNGAVTVVVEPKVGGAGWDGALGQKVVWLVNQRHQSAEMQLNPPNLGPLEVKLTIANDQANALFVSHHAAVRDAIEAALPRLREMLADNGITLGNAQVSAESFPRGQAGNGDGGARHDWQPNTHEMAMTDGLVAERAGVIRLPTPGTVDIFA